jgi:hypothetical protein
METPIMYMQQLVTRLDQLHAICTATKAAAKAPPQPGETPEDRACVVLMSLDGNLADLVCGRSLALAADVALATGTLEVSRE